MTAVEPQPVPPAPRLAILCAARAPLVDFALCRRLTGHLGEHASDGGDNWPVAPTPTEENDR